MLYLTISHINWTQAVHIYDHRSDQNNHITQYTFPICHARVTAKQHNDHIEQS